MSVSNTPTPKSQPASQPVPETTSQPAPQPTRTGALLPPTPQVRLVRREQNLTQRSWEESFPTQGYWQVTGAAGSGVSSFLVDTVVDRIEAGADPAGVVVITPSKESGAQVRQELLARLGDFASPAALVRSVHSMAFSLLRQHEESPVRLITGAEQDAVIRELLEGHAASGGGRWPDYIRPALSMVGFARQLRDFLLRAGERSLGPDELIDLGERWEQPMWEAAGYFLREYEQVMALSGHHSLNAAELVARVAARDDLLENHPWHTIVVDDAQLLDPNAGELIWKLASTASLVVVGGNPEQGVFAFRGATEDFWQEFPRRFPEVKRIDLGPSRRTPSPACIAVVDSPGTHTDVVADMVRRRHLDDGVAWRDIAVIVRGSGEIAPLRRGLLAAGVPVHINPTAQVLAQQRLVAALLQVLQALEHPVEPDVLDNLMVGPIGGADPITMRRLVRGLRRWNPSARGMETLRELLGGPLPDFGGKLTEREEKILSRMRDIFEAGRQALARNASIEETLWEVWNATDLSGRLQAAALRGGATGSQADRDLDAIMALFDLAGDYSERYPEAGLESFLRHVMEQELPTGVRDRRSENPQAVEILSAHSSVGREWDTVIVVGAQEGSWPSLGETGSIFGQEDLLDLLDDDVPPNTYVSHLPERLVQERRLFAVATTRHRCRLGIVTIEAPEGENVYEPSRFIEEFFGHRNALQASAPGVIDGHDLGLIDPLERGSFHVLSVPSFVGHLRRVVVDPSTDEVSCAQAARQLARLAQAGVPGAHPKDWWGARQVIETGELTTPPTISPSRVEALLDCPLSATLTRLVEEEGVSIPLVRGNMAHAYLEALGRGVEEPLARAMTKEAFAAVLEVPQWKREFELEQFERLLERTSTWAAGASRARDLVGVEVPVHAQVAQGVVIEGYIDRLERSGEDYFVVDLKTGSSAPTKAQAQANAQLATYQLALRGGQLSGGRITDGDGLPFGGGKLVYPATNSVEVTTRDQAPWAPEELAEFSRQLPGLVKELTGPEVTARPHLGCKKCAVRTLCPTTPEGRMLTHV